MGKPVATWQENGMLYTLTATKIEETALQTSSVSNAIGLISVYNYLGGTPQSGTGAAIYKHAKLVGAKYSVGAVDTPHYQGKIMLYEHSFLADYFNNNPNTSSMPLNKDMDDDLPF